MASAPSVSWNSPSITHLASCLNPSSPTNSSDDPVFVGGSVEIRRRRIRMSMLRNGKAASARHFGVATLALLVLLGTPLRAADDKDKKKENPPPAPHAAPQPPPRSAPQAQPAPAYHPPTPRPTPPQNNPNVGHPSNDNPNMRRARNPGNQPNNQPGNQP